MLSAVCRVEVICYTKSIMSDTIAIQGDQASFHDIAATQFFGPQSQRAFCDSFSQTFAALSSDQVDYAVCAIENSLYGSINEVYDLLLAHDFHIVGEVYLRIEQCLIGLPDATIESITEVYSHPVALAQCEQYLDITFPDVKRMEYHDTAASVALVKAQGNPAVVAIAGREAAELYGLQILAPSIETNTQNYTRFVVLSKTLLASEAANKTSLIVQTTHEPGSLYQALGSFAKRDINLTKLQSRPLTGNAWRYIFYIDVAAGSSDDAFTQALQELDEQGCRTTILGSYQSGLAV